LEVISEIWGWFVIASGSIKHEYGTYYKTCGQTSFVKGQVVNIYVLQARESFAIVRLWP
jgi:hypothetical protein